MYVARCVAPFAALMLAAAAPKATAPQLIRPLSDADQARIQESGCESAFAAGPRTYLFAMNNRIVVRTGAGDAAVCEIDGAVIDGFFEGQQTLTCGGVGLQLRHTARQQGNSQADSVSGASSLTITRGQERQQLRGESGTAC